MVIPLIHELFQVLLIRDSSALLKLFHKPGAEIGLFSILLSKVRPKKSCYQTRLIHTNLNLLTFENFCPGAMNYTQSHLCTG